MLGLDVVLIQPHADVGRLDLDQLAERIEQPPSDGNGAAERGVVFGEFLAAQLARRVDAGAGLVDDHVSHALVLEFRAEHLGEEVLGLAAGRAVADGHDGQFVLADQLDRLLLGLFLAARLAADEVNNVVPQHVAELVERGQLATALETGIDGQHAAVVDRRLEEQVAEIAGEDADGVRLGPIGQFAAGLALQRGQDQAGQRIAGAAAEIIGMRMAGRHEDFIERRIHGLEIAIDLHAEDLGPFGPIDRQHAVRRDLLDVFRVVEVVAEGLDAAFLDLLSLGIFLVLLFGLGPLAIPRTGGRPLRPAAASPRPPVPLHGSLLLPAEGSGVRVHRARLSPQLALSPR